MKNYEQITNDLLARRDRYVEEQKRKRKTVISASVSACMCLIVAVLVFGPWKGNSTAQIPAQTVNDALYPGVQDTVDDPNTVLASKPENRNKIVVHDIEGITRDTMDICRMRDDFIPMSREELTDYYGIDYVPTVPEDMKLLKNGDHGIYKRNGGTGDVYWDQNDLTYSNEDQTRAVRIGVNKGNKVYVQFVYFEGTEERSVIADVEVLIGKAENGHYYAEFMYQDVGFLIHACGVTEEEFISIIASVLD